MHYHVMRFLTTNRGLPTDLIEFPFIRLKFWSRKICQNFIFMSYCISNKFIHKKIACRNRCSVGNLLERNGNNSCKLCSYVRPTVHILFHGYRSNKINLPAQRKLDISTREVFLKNLTRCNEKERICGFVFLFVVKFNRI